MKAWPVLIGLALIAALFQALNPYFLTPRNLTNLVLQIAAMGTISAGLVLVMLLGEIDLSAGWRGCSGGRGRCSPCWGPRAR